MSTLGSNLRQLFNQLCSPNKWQFKIAHVKFTSTCENTADIKVSLPEIITLDEQVYLYLSCLVITTIEL